MRAPDHRAITSLFNATDILTAGLVQFAVGNCKGIRIPGTADNTHRNTRYSFYVGDNWRVRTNVAVNIGMRYEFDTHPLNNDLPKPDLARTLLPRGIEPTPIDKNNFAPQIGVAWDPLRNGKTSVRAGAGIFYAMRVSNLLTDERAQLAPFNSGNQRSRMRAAPTQLPILTGMEPLISTLRRPCQPALPSAPLCPLFSKARKSSSPPRPIRFPVSPSSALAAWIPTICQLRTPCNTTQASSGSRLE